MKKNFLIILVMFLAVGLLLPSYATSPFYQTGDLSKCGTLVENQTEAEMNSALKSSGCDDMETMHNTVASMTSEEDITNYLKDQADKLSNGTGCKMELVVNISGKAYSSNPSDTKYVDTNDTDFEDAETKAVAARNDGYEVFVAAYNMGSLEELTSGSISNNDDDDDDGHSCNPAVLYSTTAHVHSHEPLGEVGQQRPSVDFTSEVSDTKKDSLNVGYKFSVWGNKHIVKYFTQIERNLSGKCPSQTIAQHMDCTICSRNVWEEVVDSCNYVYWYKAYEKPTYIDEYHNVSISFEGFTATNGVNLIPGEIRQAYGKYPSDGTKTYFTQFMVTDIDEDKLKSDEESGLVYGKVIVECSCGKKYEHKVYFDFTLPPIIEEDFYSLEVKSAGGGKVRIDNGQYSSKSKKNEIKFNETSTIEAEPDEGYKFDGWCKNSEKEYEYTEKKVSINQPKYDCTFTAKFSEKDPDTYTVTLYSDGNGLVGIKDGIDEFWTSYSDQKVSLEVEEGETISIKSNPDSDFTIDYWAKIVDGREEYYTIDEEFDLTVDEDYTFIAHFKTDKISYKELIVTHDGNGYTVGGTKCAIEGKKYPIWSYPKEGFEFDRWEDDISNGPTTLAQHDFVIMPFKDSYTVKAYFTDSSSERSTLEIISDGNGKVYIDNNEPGGLSDRVNDENGKIHEIHARADEGYEFENWVDTDGNIIFNGTDEEVTLSEDVTYIACFEPINPDDKFRLDVESDGNGTVTGGTEFAEPGKEYRITADPDDDYKFDYWEKKITEEDGSDTSEKTNLPINTYFTMPAKDVKLIAHFKKDEIIPEEDEYHYLEIGSSTGGYGTGSGYYKEGEHVDIKAFSNTGYTFNNWKDEAGEISKTPDTCIVMPAHDYTVTPVFVKNDYNNSENISFQIVSIRDIRWKDYFTGGGVYSYSYLNVPNNATQNTVLLDDVNLEDAQYNQYKQVVYGYAVENRIQTVGIDYSDTTRLVIDYKLYDEYGNEITNEIKDADKYLHLEFSCSRDDSAFLTSTSYSTGTNNGVTYPIITWNWVTYLPTDLKTYSGKLVTEEYDEITVKYDIKLKFGSGDAEYDYIKVINKRSNDGSNWGGKVFTYRCDKTLLDDIYDNANN